MWYGSGPEEAELLTNVRTAKINKLMLTHLSNESSRKQKLQIEMVSQAFF